MSQSLLKQAVSASAVTRRPFNILITGMSGSGKSTGAAQLAKALGTAVDHKKVLYIDTEAGRSGYALVTVYGREAIDSGESGIDVLKWPGDYDPRDLLATLLDAESDGYECVILDTLSAFYEGTGGLLQLNGIIAQQKYGGNSYMAWNDSGKMWQSILDWVSRSPCDVIFTSREKHKYVETVKNGRKTYEKAGTGANLRQNTGYEFDLEVRLDASSGTWIATIEKSRVNDLEPGTLLNGGLTPAHAITLIESYRGFMQDIGSDTPAAVPAADLPAEKGLTVEQLKAKVASIIPSQSEQNRIFQEALQELGLKWSEAQHSPADIQRLWDKIEELYQGTADEPEEPEEEEIEVSIETE